MTESGVGGLFLPPPSPVRTNIYAILSVPGTHNLDLPTGYRFNVGSVSRPIAGSMPVNRIRRWPNIGAELGDCPVFAQTAIRVTLYRPKGRYPDNTIHWPNCEIMLATVCDAVSTLFQSKPVELLTTIIVNIFFKTF